MHDIRTGSGPYASARNIQERSRMKEHLGLSRPTETGPGPTPDVGDMATDDKPGR